MMLQYNVVRWSSDIPPSGRMHAYLVRDIWNDFGYVTLYKLTLYDEVGNLIEIGEVKFGKTDLDEKICSVVLPAVFTELSSEYFSLGQDESYYGAISNLNEPLRDEILNSLNDIVASEELWQKVRHLSVTTSSLLRFVSPMSVKGQFKRLLKGGDKLASFQFKYTAPESKSALPQIELPFKVIPGSKPPTNVHVIIGSNGVGKTYLFQEMLSSLVEKHTETVESGRFVGGTDGEDRAQIFANIVSVSFSAFDTYRPIPMEKIAENVRYGYIGLQERDNPGHPKSTDTLGQEFAESIIICRKGARRTRLLEAIKILQTDPILMEYNFCSILSEDFLVDNIRKTITEIFRKLSSGHKIVLLTITKLVELVEEQTLVLLDEPEAHLHPPLLSAFIRSLSDLLVDRNGVAILATHSPVVVQEVPKSCVWHIARSGDSVSASRLNYETFGENVGSITRDVFGLEVTSAGFYSLLKKMFRERHDYDQVIEQLGDQLGMEGRAILRALPIDIVIEDL